MRKPYPTDLTDPQWQIVEPLIPAAKAGGRPRTVDMREVLNTLFYQNRTGCQWDLLPHDLLPKSTVYDYFAQWRDDGTWQRIVDALRPKVRTAAGRKRHIAFDSLGLLLAVVVTAASIDDGEAAPRVLGQLARRRYPRLDTVYGDGKYNNRRLDAWLERTKAAFRVKVVERPDGSEGWVKLP